MPYTSRRAEQWRTYFKKDYIAPVNFGTCTASEQRGQLTKRQPYRNSPPMSNIIWVRRIRLEDNRRRDHVQSNTFLGPLNRDEDLHPGRAAEDCIIEARKTIYQKKEIELCTPFTNNGWSRLLTPRRFCRFARPLERITSILSSFNRNERHITRLL